MAGSCPRDQVGLMGLSAAGVQRGEDGDGGGAGESGGGGPVRPLEQAVGLRRPSLQA